MSLTIEAREDAAQILEKTEVFEDETTIFSTYEVDPAYDVIVRQMASAMWDHDHGMSLSNPFPTGDGGIDDPYLCRADDALREALPLLRTKFADEIRNSTMS